MFSAFDQSLETEPPFEEIVWKSLQSKLAVADTISLQKNYVLQLLSQSANADVHGVFSVYWTTPGCCFQG
jgi:hypothetical protein